MKVVRVGLGWWWTEEGVREAPIQCSVSAVNKWLFSALAIIFADDRNRGHRLVDELTREGRAAVTESGALDEGGGTMGRVGGLCCEGRRKARVLSLYRERAWNLGHAR